MTVGNFMTPREIILLKQWLTKKNTHTSSSQKDGQKFSIGKRSIQNCALLSLHENIEIEKMRKKK